MSFRTCDHLKQDGAPCGSPALRGQKLCYFHQRDHLRRHYISQLRRRAEILRLPDLETLQDVQVALYEVIDALAANRIDQKRAGALLFALQQASLQHRAPQTA